MRNVRSALLVAAVGLMGLTACSFSSSRSWGSGNGSTANPNGAGKPAQKSKGKPAHQVADNGKPAAHTPTPKPAVEPAPKPAPETPPADKEPTRVGRTDEPATTSVGVTNSTLTSKPSTPEPAPSGTIGTAPTPPAENPKDSKAKLGAPTLPANPGGLKPAPVKPATPVNKLAPAK